jgi:hypothetical protein
METLDDILEHMRSVCKNYDAIGGGHAAQPIRDWIQRIEAWRRAEEDFAWRQEVCNRLGLSCDGGATWTTDEFWEHVNYLLKMEAKEWRAPAGVNRGDRKAAISGTDTILRIGGQSVRCECKANVFSKTLTEGYYRCNGCDAGYESLPA